MGNKDIPSICVLFGLYPAISKIVGPKSMLATSIYENEGRKTSNLEHSWSGFPFLSYSSSPTPPKQHLLLSFVQPRFTEILLTESCNNSKKWNIQIFLRLVIRAPGKLCIYSTHTALEQKTFFKTFFVTSLGLPKVLMNHEKMLRYFIQSVYNISTVH